MSIPPVCEQCLKHAKFCADYGDKLRFYCSENCQRLAWKHLYKSTSTINDEAIDDPDVMEVGQPSSEMTLSALQADMRKLYDDNADRSTTSGNYFVKNTDNDQYERYTTSVTKIAKKFYGGTFDIDAVSAAQTMRELNASLPAEQRKKFDDLSAEEKQRFDAIRAQKRTNLLETGNRSLALGNTLHTSIDEFFNGKRTLEQVPPGLEDRVLRNERGEPIGIEKGAWSLFVEFYNNEIKDKYDFVSSEQILFDREKKIGGTADIVLRKRDAVDPRNVVLMDWKRVKNYKLTRQGKPPQSRRAREYNLQVNMYKWLSERAQTNNRIGVDGMFVVNLHPENGKYQMIAVEPITEDKRVKVGRATVEILTPETAVKKFFEPPLPESVLGRRQQRPDGDNDEGDTNADGQPKARQRTECALCGSECGTGNFFCVRSDQFYCSQQCIEFENE